MEEKNKKILSNIKNIVIIILCIVILGLLFKIIKQGYDNKINELNNTISQLAKTIDDQKMQIENLETENKKLKSKGKSIADQIIEGTYEPSKPTYSTNE